MIRALLLLFLAGSLRAAVLIDFPTANHALLRGPSGNFFMYVDRDFEGERSKPWQGGQFGYVRGPQRIGGEVFHTAIHEGVDIRPLTRDSAGNPTDKVLAAADGKVVYVNASPGGSNYGRYVVVEHRIQGSPYYSLYAHLASADVEPGMPVRQGAVLGTMGYSGSGLDKTRAHVHFEFAMMMSPNFEAWHERTYPGDANPHGIYNGRNLAGVDPADLLLAARKDGEAFDLRRFLRGQDAYFKVAIPAPLEFPLIRDYPWLLDGAVSPRPPGWMISFSRYGVPVHVEPWLRPITEPTVTWVRDSRYPDASATRGLVSTSGTPKLTRSGRQLIGLLCTPAAP